MSKKEKKDTYIKGLNRIVRSVSLEIYKKISFVSNVMGIDIDLIIRDCQTDFNQFYEIISMYYNDYHIEKEVS